MKMRLTPNSALRVISEGRFKAVETTHQYSPLRPSVSLSRGAESFPHCALSQLKYNNKNSEATPSTVFAVAVLANLTRERGAAVELRTGG